MEWFQETARAKINLFLDVVARRPDGFHDIDGVMQSISLSDVVMLAPAPQTTVLCDVAEAPSDQSNLAFRAAEHFFRATGRSGGVSIRIEKGIPVAAGLAGGSADAAAVLRGLNRLYHTGLSVSQLCQIGASLGADVPFCIVGGTQRTEGIGDKMTPVASMPDCWLVVSKGEERISTPAAYAAIDAYYKDDLASTENQSGCFCRKRTVAPLLLALSAGNIVTVACEMYNIFEQVVPDSCVSVSRIRDDLKKAGAIAAMMSGSGPSVFGVFCDEERATRAAAMLREKGVFATVCRPER